MHWTFWIHSLIFCITKVGWSNLSIIEKHNIASSLKQKKTLITSSFSTLYSKSWSVSIWKLHSFQGIIGLWMVINPVPWDYLHFVSHFHTRNSNFIPCYPSLSPSHTSNPCFVFLHIKIYIQCSYLNLFPLCIFLYSAPRYDYPFSPCTKVENIKKCYFAARLQSYVCISSALP